MKEREGKTGKEWGEMTDKKTQMASCRVVEGILFLMWKVT